MSIPTPWKIFRNSNRLGISKPKTFKGNFYLLTWRGWRIQTNHPLVGRVYMYIQKFTFLGQNTFIYFILILAIMWLILITRLDLFYLNMQFLTNNAKSWYFDYNTEQWHKVKSYQKNKPVHLNTVVLDHFQTVFFWQNLKRNLNKPPTTMFSTRHEIPRYNN